MRIVNRIISVLIIFTLTITIMTSFEAGECLAKEKSSQAEKVLSKVKSPSKGWVRYLDSGIVVYGLDAEPEDGDNDSESQVNEATYNGLIKKYLPDFNDNELDNEGILSDELLKYVKTQDEPEDEETNVNSATEDTPASTQNNDEPSDTVPSFKPKKRHPSAGKSVTEKNFGNVTVTVTIDIGENTRTTQTKTVDPATGVVTKDYVTEYVDIGNTSTWSEVIDPTNFGYIYVGDSRFLGLDMITKLSSEENTWVYAEVSKGYNWLDSFIVNKIRETEAANPEIDCWFEIYTLGINDMGNEARYMKWYRNRAKDHNVILVSTNPIERHSSITNARIERFNKSLKDTGIDYVDCYGHLMENNNYSTVDGVHFSVTANKAIKDYVQQCVKELAIDSQKGN